MQMIIRDNKGTEREVELDAVPSKGDRIVLDHDGTDESEEPHHVSVKEIDWYDGGGIVVAVVDGFVAR